MLQGRGRIALGHGFRIPAAALPLAVFLDYGMSYPS